MNDGVSPGSQGIAEDPRWEGPLRAVRSDSRGYDAVLLAVCHTFGVMCRWLGVAEGPFRGRRSRAARARASSRTSSRSRPQHPWFGRLARELPDRRRLRVLDSRLYDLIPRPGPLPDGVTIIAHETLGVGGPRGEAVTMVEFARDADGVMPRIFAVNHHPEIVNRPRQLTILRKRMDRGEVTADCARSAWPHSRRTSTTTVIARCT